MYKIKSAIKKTIDQILGFNQQGNGLKLKAQRNRQSLPALTYQWDEFAEMEDNVQNGLLSLTLASSKEKGEIEHNKLIGTLKNSLNELGFTQDVDGEDISGRFIFNSISDVTSQDDLIETSLIFDVRFFKTETCK